MKLFSVTYLFRGREYRTVVEALTVGDAMNVLQEANREVEIVHVQEA